MPDENTEFKWTVVNSVDEMEQFFISIIPNIRFIARECGYAVGVHGSLRRDLDLIVVPWVEDPVSLDVLARSIHFAACGYYSKTYNWEKKPLGRMAVSMPVCWVNFDIDKDIPSQGHIDLSVFLGEKD